MTDIILDTDLTSGFENPVPDAQAGFRRILEALSRPGRLCRIPNPPPAPAPLYPNTAAIFLTLLDMDTPLWLPGGDDYGTAVNYLRFHCGCPVVDASERAAFALVPDGRQLPSFGRFSPGSPEYPDRSTTLVVQVASLNNERHVRLTGPGIQTEAFVSAQGLDAGFWREMDQNHQQFPQGLDVLLVSPQCICGLPRTTKVEVQGCM